MRGRVDAASRNNRIDPRRLPDSRQTRFLRVRLVHTQSVQQHRTLLDRRKTFPLQLLEDRGSRLRSAAARRRRVHDDVCLASRCGRHHGAHPRDPHPARTFMAKLEQDRVPVCRARRRSSPARCATHRRWWSGTSATTAPCQQHGSPSQRVSPIIAMPARNIPAGRLGHGNDCHCPITPTGAAMFVLPPYRHRTRSMFESIALCLGLRAGLRTAQGGYARGVVSGLATPVVYCIVGAV
jgi:hypothetical protein